MNESWAMRVSRKWNELRKKRVSRSLSESETLRVSDRLNEPKEEMVADWKSESIRKIVSKRQNESREGESRMALVGIGSEVAFSKETTSGRKSLTDERLATILPS